MSRKQPYLSDGPPGYMENVPVKISERYKPPKRIAPALTQSQRSALQRALDSGTTSPHEFSLERSIAAKMPEWRSARDSIRLERAERCRRRRQQHQQHHQQQQQEDPADSERAAKPSGGEILFPSVQKHDIILKPVPIPYAASRRNEASAKGGPFYLAEFEEDTSSPFDNMELKTINDLEELAQVLRVEEPPPNGCYTSYNHLHHHQILDHIPPLLNAFGPAASAAGSGGVAAPSPDEQKVVSVARAAGIVRSLESELESCRIAAAAAAAYEEEKRDRQRLAQHLVQPPAAPSSSVAAAAAGQDEAFLKLSARLQQLAREVSAMGFPLPRVARVCHLIGDDHKKVVDHLLALSDLLDLGFKEEVVTRALLKFDNDKDRALDELIT